LCRIKPGDSIGLSFLSPDFSVMCSVAEFWYGYHEAESIKLREARISRIFGSAIFLVVN